MHVEDVEQRIAVDVDIGAQTAALLAAGDAQIVVAGGADGPAADHHIAVAVAAMLAVFTECMRHSQLARNGLGLVAQHFLQGDDIGVNFAQDLRRCERAHAAVHTRGTCGRCR